MVNYGADKQEHSYRDTVEFLAHKFNLNDKEKRELLPSGRMPIFDNRVSWALFYLKKAGLLEGTRRGFYRIELLKKA